MLSIVQRMMKKEVRMASCPWHSWRKVRRRWQASKVDVTLLSRKSNFFFQSSTSKKTFRIVCLTHSLFTHESSSSWSEGFLCMRQLSKHTGEPRMWRSETGGVHSQHYWVVTWWRGDRTFCKRCHPEMLDVFVPLVCSYEAHSRWRTRFYDLAK